METNAAARELTSILIAERNLVAEVMSTADKDMAHLISQCREELPPTKSLAASAQQTIEYRLNRLERDLGKSASRISTFIPLPSTWAKISSGIPTSNTAQGYPLYHLPPPTFHEIPALGSWLYKNQEFDNET